MQVEQGREHRGVQGCTQVGRQGLLVVVEEEVEDLKQKEEQINTPRQGALTVLYINASDVWYLTLIWPHVLLLERIRR